MGFFAEKSMYRRALAAGVGVTVTLGAIGCGGSSNTSGTKPKAGVERQLPPPDLSGPARAKIIARLSREARGQATLPSGFCEYSNAHPQPMYGQNPGRLIVDSLCQPPLGEPVGVYEGATFSSDKAGEVTDGEVVKSMCVDTHGQSTTNVLGPVSASTTWVEVTHGTVEGFVSEVNLGYVDDSQFNEC
jgi:hypothetical protein